MIQIIIDSFFVYYTNLAKAGMLRDMLMQRAHAPLCAHFSVNELALIV